MDEFGEPEEVGNGEVSVMEVGANLDKTKVLHCWKLSQ